MDDLDVLARDFGFKPAGKSAPMRSDGGDRRSSSVRSSNSSPLFDDPDSLLYKDVFTKSSNNNSKYSSMNDINYDSIFKSDSNSNHNHNNNNNKTSSLPVYDKPVYDEDIFDGLPGLKNKSVTEKSASAVRFDDDVFAKMTSTPQPKHKEEHFGDLLGNLKGNEKKVTEPKNSTSSSSAREFDDLLAGFGSSSTSTTNKRSFTESSQYSKPAGNPNQSSSMLDDPFAGLGSTSIAASSSPGEFMDPLEDIGQLGKSGNVKSEASSVSGGGLGDLDPLNGFSKSVPPFYPARNNRGTEGSPQSAGSGRGDTQTSTSRVNIGKSPSRSSGSRSQKKVPGDSFQDSPLFDMPSADPRRSFGQAASPPYASSNIHETNFESDTSPRSEEQMQPSDDVWLSVSEIPLFTQPTRAPPPSRPPPPIPRRNLKSDSNARKKGDRYSSSPSYNQYSESPKLARPAAQSPPISQLDELDEFAMGRSPHSVDEGADIHSGEDMSANSVAAASAAAMKEAMDRAQAKFRHAKEVREREYAKAAKSKEAVNLDREEQAMHEMQEKELRENKERLEREHQQREKEEEERAQQKLERERERAREMERDRGRQAVERATREARERAAAEARERAAADARLKTERAAVEKAAAEARERAERAAVQRAQAEARERAAAEARDRAQKAAAEAREKEAREKASAAKAEAEARRRAERAAVERAAAEVLPESNIAPHSPSATEVLPIPTVGESSVTPPRLPATDTPLLTYHRRPRPASGPADSRPAPDPAPTADLSLPIALRKGIRTTLNPNPHYVGLSYHRLSSPYYAFLSSLSSVSIPKSTGEALSHPGWRQAMNDEMSALHTSGTWELVPLPSGKSTVGCRWVYAVKVGPDGKVDRLKARLVAKGYTQIFGLDYSDTFSPVAKIASVRLFLSMAAVRHWPLYQLDIKNAFLHGDLEDEVYMEQPPGFVAQGESRGLVCRLRRSLYGLKQSPRAWFGKFSTVIQEFGMTRSEADHSVFYRHSASSLCIYLVVYVDDIVITGNDQDGITQLKQHLFQHFQTKDLGKLKYFLGIEVAQSSSGIVISQRKYALDILEETGMTGCRPVDTPMDPNSKLLPGQGEPLSDPARYRRLVGKLNYLTVTRPDISFPVSVVSQFMGSPCDSHWDAVVRILRYIKSTPGKGLLFEDRGHEQIVGYSDADWAGSPSDRRSTSGYCVLVGGNLVSWKSKKQNVVARSSAEAEYRAMAMATCELIWIKQLLKELKFGEVSQMGLVCDNQAALHIASNPVFHERTKHIEIDCHFVREKILSGDIATKFVKSNDQLADIFTKSLTGPRINYICNKLGTYDLYAPA